MGIQPKTMSPGSSVKQIKKELPPMKKGGSKPSYKKGGSMGKKKC